MERRHKVGAEARIFLSKGLSSLPIHIFGSTVANTVSDGTALVGGHFAATAMATRIESVRHMVSDVGSQEQANLAAGIEP